MIHIGDTESGQRVEIPIAHSGIFGRTGSGKTKLLKYMISQVPDEYQVVIFDSKITGPEFEDMGEATHFYIEESTDPDVVRSLVEGVRIKGRGNMERYRAGFIEICKGTQSFTDILKRLQEKLDDEKHIKGWTRSMYNEIHYDFARLLDIIDEHEFLKQLPFDATPKIVRIPTWKLPNLALQGLVVRSVVEKVMRTRHHVIFVIDEASNFVSQRKYNPAKESLVMLDSQGRSKNIWGWFSDQTLTGFDKSAMKNILYYIMGNESERNEAKDVYETQTYKIFSIDEIKQLKPREFIISSAEWTQKVTVPFLKDVPVHHEVDARPAILMAPPQEEENWSEIAKRLERLEAKLKSGEIK